MNDNGYRDPERYRLHAEVCRVLTDPKRLMLLDVLRDGEYSVGDLAEELGCNLANASQHLAVLRSAGQSSAHDPVDHIACLDEFRLGQAVEDRCACPARVYKAGRTKHGKVLTRVREVASQFLGKVADRVLTFAQHVQ